MLAFLTFILWLLGLALPVLLGTWTYLNAEMRGIKRPGFWGVLVAALPLYIGWIIYMIYRTVKAGKQPVQAGPAQPSVMTTADDWAVFTTAPMPTNKQKKAAAKEPVDNKALASKVLMVFWICFAVNIVLWLVTSVLFISALAAVLSSGVGSLSQSITDITSQITIPTPTPLS